MPLLITADPPAWLMVVMVLILVGLPLLIGALYMVLNHRRNIAAITAKAGTSANTQNAELLKTQVEALQQRCAKLEEQLLDVQMQLSDERRTLDNKLAAMLEQAPDSSHADPLPRATQREPLRG